jgi:CRISPR locus-related DNA-binding protein
MSGVLISTIYEKSNSTKFSIRDFNIKKVVLLVDKKSDKTQLQTINLIKKAFGDVLEIVEKRVEVYDILSVSKDVIKIIDSIQSEHDVYVDISQGRKSQALGVLLACYARSDRIKKIVYWGPEGEISMLPKLNFNVNGDSKKILREIENSDSIVDLAKTLRVSRAQLYRNIRNLASNGLLEKENNKFVLTDAGKIASM